MSTQALMVATPAPTATRPDRQDQRSTARPANPRVAPGRRPARRAPRVLGPRTGAARRVARPLGVPAPQLRSVARPVTMSGAATAPQSLGWQLTDRGLAVVMGLGGLLIVLAMVAIVGTFFAVTAELPSATPFAGLG